MLRLYLKMLKIKIILNTLRLGKEIARALRFRGYARWKEVNEIDYQDLAL